MHSHQEPIVERFQRVVFGRVVARAHEHQSFQRTCLPAPAKDTLVERHQQAVENGAVGVQELIEEHQRRLRQHAFGVCDELAFSELADVERSEELVRLGEPREQIVERLAPEPRA